MLLLEGEPVYTGVLRFEVTLVYDEVSIADIARTTPEHEPVVDVVFLAWHRAIGGPWQRATNYRTGSYAEGPFPRYPHGRRPRREIYSREDGAILPWTDRLPGLAERIREVEATLPQ